MNAIQYIRMSLNASADFTLKLVDDLRDQPVAFPTPRGGNHALWVIGHMAFAEGALLQALTNKPNPYAHWAKTLASGSEPTSNPADYPPFEEARAAFVSLRGQTLQFLETLSDADLDRPSHCRPEVAPFIGTFRQCFFVLTANPIMHFGQLADVRRSLGRGKLII